MLRISFLYFSFSFFGFAFYESILNNQKKTTVPNKTNRFFPRKTLAEQALYSFNLLVDRLPAGAILGKKELLILMQGLKLVNRPSSINLIGYTDIFSGATL